jgi:DNA repair protein RecO (recombination protein O)
VRTVSGQNGFVYANSFFVRRAPQIGIVFSNSAAGPVADGARDNLDIPAVSSCINIYVMSARVSEAFVLQTWPFREADAVVSFFTRDQGKLRGVARRARRPKSGFGSGLERLSQIRMSYYQRENRELVNIDSCELVQSQFSVLHDFPSACALDFLAEVSEQLLPANEPGEKHFRLLTTVLEHLRSETPGAVWRAVTYFSVWAVKLAGFLPDMHVCLGCGAWLGGLPTNNDPEHPARAFFSRFTSGLHCDDCRRALHLNSTYEMPQESRAIAQEILHSPIGQLPDRAWTQSTAADLRRFLAQQIESHIERRLITVPVLEAAA